MSQEPKPFQRPLLPSIAAITMMLLTCFLPAALSHQTPPASTLLGGDGDGDGDGNEDLMLFLIAFFLTAVLLVIDSFIAVIPVGAPSWKRLIRIVGVVALSNVLYFAISFLYGEHFWVLALVIQTTAQHIYLRRAGYDDEVTWDVLLSNIVMMLYMLFVQ